MKPAPTMKNAKEVNQRMTHNQTLSLYFRIDLTDPLRAMELKEKLKGFVDSRISIHNSTAKLDRRCRTIMDFIGDKELTTTQVFRKIRLNTRRTLQRDLRYLVAIGKLKVKQKRVGRSTMNFYSRC